MDRLSLRRAHPAFAACAIALGVALSVLGARQLGWLERLELTTFDHYVGLLPSSTEEPRVAIVEVSEADIQKLGTYPIPDGALARVIETLLDSGARAIGIDIYRDIPVPPGSAQLDAVFTTQPRVIVVSKFADQGASGVGPPSVLEGSEQVGFNNMVIDHDGSVRRGLLYMDDGHDGFGTSLAFQLALLYLGDEGIYPEADPDDPAILRLGESRFPPLPTHFGGYVGVDNGGYQFALDYRGAPSTFAQAGFGELLAGEAAPETFRDRIVLIGVAAESLTDRFHIPFRAGDHAGLGIPGAELHGRIADQIIRVARGETAPLRSPSGWLNALLVIASAALGAGLILWMRTGWGLILLGIAGLSAFWTTGWLALQGGWWTPVLPPALAWTATLSAVAIYSRVREHAERNELMHLFSRHVTKQVAENVWRHRDEFLEGGRPRPV
ncbi:MAG: CHASE2 domain-containing protein, partial [Deltaproteobacteria bacterium]|nr:CHASE2 domain-containing protein [Deltaproteobacteria bacterium]